MADETSPATSRAEARRRARHRAQGHDGEEERADEAQERGAAPAPGGFLSRVFPPAPPLPGMPDPLAGFSYAGPMPGFVSGLYLLARAPRWWVLGGALWAIGEIVARLGPGNAWSAVLASVVSFGALIAAGWFGWQRPWAFGLAAALFGVALFAGIVGTAILQAGAESLVGVSGPAVFLGLVSQESFQLFFGAIAGWYGGYLRRRVASTGEQGRSGSGRRRGGSRR